MQVTMPQFTSKVTSNLGIIAVNTASEESWFYQAVDF